MRVWLTNSGGFSCCGWRQYQPALSTPYLCQKVHQGEDTASPSSADRACTLCLCTNIPQVCHGSKKYRQNHAATAREEANSGCQEGTQHDARTGEMAPRLQEWQSLLSCTAAALPMVALVGVEAERTVTKRRHAGSHDYPFHLFNFQSLKQYV